MVHLTKALLLASSLTKSATSKTVVDCKKCADVSLLESPTIGIDINSGSLTAAVKHVNGSHSVLAQVRTDADLQALLYAWGLQPQLYPREYDWEYDGDSSADKPDTSTSEVISHSLTTLLDDLSAHHSALDPRRLPFAIGLPFYTPRRYFPTIQDGAAKAGLIASDKSGLVTYSDVAAHKLYNAQLCIHHIHPHAPLCSSGGFERGIFDTLVFEYSASILSITWIETLSPMTYTFGGFADTSLGKESQKNERNYWNAMSERLLPLVQSIDKERSREDPRPPTSELGKNQIIFLGSLGEDKPLRYFLRDVLSKTRFDFDQTIVHDSIEPQHTGACAIAALLKAIIDDPEPPHCSESVECEELREKIYHQALSDHGPGDEL